VVLSTNKREETIDGVIGDKTVQIKYSDSQTIKNIDIGEAEKYDIIILVLSNNSNHFPEKCDSNFVMYKIEYEVLFKISIKTTKHKYTLTKKEIT